MNEPTKPQTAGDRLLEAAKWIVGHYTREDYAALEGQRAPGRIAGEYTIADALALRDAIAAYESQPKQDEVLDALDDMIDYYRPNTAQDYHDPNCKAMYESWTKCTCSTHEKYRAAREILKKHGRNV